LKELYGKIASLDNTLFAFHRSAEYQYSGESISEEQLESILIELHDIATYFRPRRIFFDEETSNLIERLLELEKHFSVDLTYPKRAEEEGPQLDTAFGAFKGWAWLNVLTS